jgi:hypothetical protein
VSRTSPPPAPMCRPKESSKFSEHQSLDPFFIHLSAFNSRLIGTQYKPCASLLVSSDGPTPHLGHPNRQYSQAPVANLRQVQSAGGEMRSEPVIAANLWFATKNERAKGHDQSHFAISAVDLILVRIFAIPEMKKRKKKHPQNEAPDNALHD